MFTNIHRKIRTIGIISFYVGVIIAFYAGASVMSMSQVIGGLTFIGLAIIIGGGILSYAIACLIYGFGDLIARTIKTNKLLDALIEADIEAEEE